jgi:tetratricopeptide (TPR) repeat protein
MPSLAQAWHRRLGKLLGARAGEEAAAGARPARPPVPRAKARAFAVPGDTLAAEIIDLSAEVDDLAEEGAPDVHEGMPEEASKLSEGTDTNGDVRKDMPSGSATPAEPVGPTLGPMPAQARPLARRKTMIAPARTPAADASKQAATEAGGAAAAGPATQVAAEVGATTEAAAVTRAATEATTAAAAPAVAAEATTEAVAAPQAATEAAAAPQVATEADAVTQGAPEVVETATPTPVASVRTRTLVVAPPPELPPEPEPEPEWSGPIAVVPARLDDPLVDEARAAEHLRLAGDFDAAAEHLCEAARKAADMGAPQAAVQHANEAMALLSTLPPSATRRHLRVSALIVIGRVQWQAAGYDLGFTLGQALATLDSARADIGADAPADLAVDLAQALAGVCFDLGDLRSLERALAELETAGKIMRAAGDEVGAACLLNDQAAVLVRLGNPGRALPLLKQSRQAFDARAGEDPVALRELAETEHLFARLPLSVTLRPGREQEGFEMGLTHARAAERAYHELGEARELGRVWETMGRLELRRGQLDAAKQRLESSLEVLTQLGDLMGLAQTTEALAELRAVTGADAEAVTHLRDSVVFNRDKGSPVGLMSNRQVFTALSERLAGQPQHADGLQEVAVLLGAGERELGIRP